MKFTSQEEYGLRCMLSIARLGDNASLTIPEISKAEGISAHYVGKLMRVLRSGGFVKAARGHVGGYTLSRTADRIKVGEVLAVLGGRLFEPGFCTVHAGSEEECTNRIDCSIRSLWRAVQGAVDDVLGRITLKDLLRSEQELTSAVIPITRLTDNRLVHL